MLDQLQYISLDQIDEPADPVRSAMNDQTLSDLVESIKAVGIIQPLTVKRVGDRFEIVAGHRRFIAARMAGLVTVPCIIPDLKNVSDVAIKLHENFCREEINPVDEAFILQDMIDKNAYSIDSLAQITKRSKGYIRNKLRILSYQKDIKEALLAGKINASVAKHLSRITDDDQRIEYLGFAIHSGASIRVVQTWSEDFQRGELVPKVEERIEQDKETGETKTIPFITCQLCGGDIEIGKQKLIFVHEECIEEYKKMYNAQ